MCGVTGPSSQSVWAVDSETDTSQLSDAASSNITEASATAGVIAAVFGSEDAESGDDDDDDDDDDDKPSVDGAGGDVRRPAYTGLGRDISPLLREPLRKWSPGGEQVAATMTGTTKTAAEGDAARPSPPPALATRPPTGRRQTPAGTGARTAGRLRGVAPRKQCLCRCRWGGKEDMAAICGPQPAKSGFFNNKA